MISSTGNKPALVRRKTRETEITVELDRAGGASRARAIDTGLPFFNHMLSTLAHYAGVGLTLSARGDLRHHLMEDAAIALGAAFARVVPENAARFAERCIAMDDALVHVVVDIGGRFYYRGPLRNRLYDHWMRSFAEHARMTLHLRVLRGRDSHHVTECAFKALGLALRDAMKEEGGAVFSTKGAVALEVS